MLNFLALVVLRFVAFALLLRLAAMVYHLLSHGVAVSVGGSVGEGGGAIVSVSVAAAVAVGWSVWVGAGVWSPWVGRLEWAAACGSP